MSKEHLPNTDLPFTLAWNVNDVARELKCSVRHVYKLVYWDRIPFAKVGRLLRFSPERIRAWLEKGGTR